MELQKVDLHFSQLSNHGKEHRPFLGEYVRIGNGKTVPHQGAQGESYAAEVSPTVYWQGGYDRLLDLRDWTIQVFDSETKNELLTGVVSFRTGPTPHGEADVEFTVF